MTSTPSDFLRTQQYQDASNLSARIALHQRFSTSAYPWHRWLFERLHLPAEARILELGCGSAALWVQNADRIPAGWEITLTDFSAGMLAAAQQAVEGTPGLYPPGPLFRFQQADAQELPFEAEGFDAVIANHMLYHVPDRPRAFAEIRRVLKPGGKLFAATNGKTHMTELHALEDEYDPHMVAARRDLFRVHDFCLENAAGQMKPFFSTVEMEPFPDALQVTEAGPLVAYILSMSSPELPDPTAANVERLRQIIQRRLEAEGVIHITKSAGVFTAVK